MRTYYSGFDAVVTSELFVWRKTPATVFAIRELRGVGITRTPVDRGRPHTTQVAAGSLTLAVATWPMVDTPALIALGVLIIAVPTLGVTAYRRSRDRLWELHATYRGQPVIMYASTSDRVFHQVTRALRRAMEDMRPHGTFLGEAV